MKEFRGQTGGRYTYIDDFENLQELALAFGTLLNDCDNFIITGCEVEGTTITPGYVYLDGKIRVCNGRSGITQWPQIIYGIDEQISIGYADSASKLGRVDYKCGVGDTANGSTQIIRVPQTGGLRMREALFGRYSLLLQTTAASQDVVGKVNFKNAASVSNTLTLGTDLRLEKNSNAGSVFYDGNVLVVQNRVQNGDTVQFRLDCEGGIKVLYNSHEICALIDGQFVVSNKMTAPNAEVDSIVIGDNYMYGATTEGVATLYINQRASSSTNAVRTTVIGNGKNKAVMTINDSVAINSSVYIKDAGIVSMTSSKTLDQGVSEMMLWSCPGYTAASIGFNSAQTPNFIISSGRVDIQITGKEAVNIGPKIKENGELLESKYMTKRGHDASLQAALASMYSRVEINGKFAQIGDGLSQFIGPKTKAALRGEIDAIALTDVEGTYLRIDGKLAGVANSAEDKKAACRNIGAAYVDDVQQRLYDSGWISVGRDQLYARQIGQVVYIQGRVHTFHSGELFTLPNGIGAPAHATSMSAPHRKWGCVIEQGDRKCYVWCGGDHGDDICFTLTYIAQ